MKSYNELFHDRFHKSSEIDAKFINIYKTKGLKDAIEYLKDIGATELDMDNYNIKCKISEWTKNALSNDEKIQLLYKLKFLEDYVLDVNIENSEEFNLPQVVIKTSKGIIQAIQFSSLIPEVKKKFPFIESEERFGNCYDFAYHISLNLGIANEIVTGYIYGYSDKSKFLHSWIEVTIKGKEYVIDGTLNAIINKQGYYLMQHAKPITKINSTTFRNDIKNYMVKIQAIPPEVYFVFRNEIIADLEKNQNIFKR